MKLLDYQFRHRQLRATSQACGELGILSGEFLRQVMNDTEIASHPLKRLVAIISELVTDRITMSATEKIIWDAIDFAGQHRKPS